MVTELTDAVDADNVYWFKPLEFAPNEAVMYVLAVTPEPTMY